MNIKSNYQTRISCSNKSARYIQEEGLKGETPIFIAEAKQKKKREMKVSVGGMNIRVIGKKGKRPIAALDFFVTFFVKKKSKKNTTAQRQGYQAIYLNTVSNSKINDNDLTRFGNHVSILNNCNGTAVTCNRFYRGGTTGIYNSTSELLQTIKLTNATVSDLGTTSSSANNEWNSDYSTTTAAQNYRIVGNTVGLVQPKYYILSADPTTKKPNPFLVMGTGLNTQLATTVNTCNPGIPLIILNDDNEAEHTDADIAKDNELPDSLLIIETVLNYETVYDSTNTASGYFADLAIYNLGQILVDSGYVDSATFIATFEETDISAIMELNDALVSADSTSAAALCAALVGSELVMQNIKTMNAFLIKSDNYHFTGSDSSIIYGIAYQKVQNGGPAVVTARNWLGIYLNDAELSATPKSNAYDDDTEYKWEINLYPNPSKGLLKIESNNNENLKLSIFDILGNLITSENNVVSGNTLEFKNLTSGIYLIQISDVNQNLKNFRWTIEK
jgi:Secretion system C-terminal sorting domain